MTARTLFLVALALTSPSAVLAQESTPAPQEAAAEVRLPEPAVPSSPEYEIGPGDVLSVRVSGVREFDQALRVSNSGRIRVPYVGIVFAAGMTTMALEQEIASKIRDHELVKEPLVRVQVSQHRARPVNIVGEVTTPGQFMLTSEMYLLDLITRAGGLVASADATGLLYRRAPQKPAVSAKLIVEDPSDEAADPAQTPETPVPAPTPTPAAEPEPAEAAGEAQVIPIDLDALRDGSRPDLNVQLQGGDVFYVPRRKAKTFYIIGDVITPGAYGMPRRGGVTAAQAISYAGGPMMTAKNHSAFLMRHDANGVRQAIEVDFLAIVKGKQPDIPVQPDDIIFIPSSPVKQIGIGLLNLVPRLLQQFIIF
jgi:polysaccharide export outer membrane protein